MERIESSDGILYGFGIFETIKIIEGKIQHLENHYKRLKYSAQELEIEFNLNFDEFKAQLLSSVIYVTENISVLRYTLIRKNHSSCYAIDIRKYIYEDEIYKKGFKLTLSPIKHSKYSKIVYHKTINYLDNLLELKRVKALGFNDSIYMNELGDITECGTANIYIVKNKIIYTPLLSCGLLCGTMRENIIERCKQRKIKIFEKKIDLKELLLADEIFISNALLGIMKVVKIDDKSFSSDFIDYIKKELKL